jgi:hypothetical protein
VAAADEQHDDRTLELPKAADLAHDVTLFGTYEQAKETIGVSITFQYHETFDRARLASIAENARRMFEARS